MLTAFITGLQGQRLTDAERQFLRGTRPCGIILFSRNCSDPGQVQALIAEAKAAIGSDRVLVAVDQEGGRVQRLRPPQWGRLPAAAAIGAIYARDPGAGCLAARSIAHLAADELRRLGFTMNCAPVLDLPVAGAHAVISDRAYGTDPQAVAQLGRAVMNGLMAGGLVPVIKHIPGHGRATSDSHFDLPVVDTDLATLEATDFAPFRALNDAPAAMTAHVVFAALDSQRPASISTLVTQQVIRGSIGFGGLLLSDDLSMRALAGSLAARTNAVHAAGSDLALHCNGVFEEMEAVAAASPPLTGRSEERFERALAATATWEPLDRSAAEASLAEALSTLA